MAADVNAEIDKVREQNSRMITVENRGIKKMMIQQSSTLKVL